MKWANEDVGVDGHVPHQRPSGWVTILREAGTEPAPNVAKEHAELKVEGVEMIAPHRKNRKRRKTQDGRPLRRYARRWKRALFCLAPMAAA